jgi:hypothetical protein
VVGSNDGGQTFTAPVAINDDGQSFWSGYYDSAIFAGPAVGPNGELYVVWHDLNNAQIKFDRDLDGLWGQNSNFGDDVIITDLRANLDHFKPPACPNGNGFDNGPSIDVSRSGAFNGRIYLTYTDRYSGNDTDIYMITSDDKGQTWSMTGSVNGKGNVENSTGTDFKPTVAVDQTTGSVNVGYYTTAGTGTNTDVNFRVASSIDGGGSWTRANLSSKPSQAKAAMTENQGFGDYEGLAAYGGTVHGFWTDNRGQATSTSAFTATASFQSISRGNTLFVTGSYASSIIDVRSSPVNRDYVEVFVNGQNEYTGLWASLNAVNVSGLYGFGGNDLITIDYPELRRIPVFVYGNDGNDTIRINLPSNLILVGIITVDGGEGTNKLILSNEQDPYGCNYRISSSAVTVTNSALGAYPVAVPRILYSHVQRLAIYAGSGDDRFIISNPIGVALPITPVTVSTTTTMAALTTTSTSSTATVSVAYTWTGTSGGTTSLLPVIGVVGTLGPLPDPNENNPIFIDGGDGSNTLFGARGQNTWTINGQNEGYLENAGGQLPGYVGTVGFRSVENLSGGIDSDTFVFANTAGAISGRIDGRGGSNWLDYSQYDAPVSVQLGNVLLGTLNHGSATAIAAVYHIQNVIGSKTAANTLSGNNDPLGNILVGGDAADAISGGTARSILIGGLGADVVTGGTAGDIVIGDTTDYDHNEAALAAIMAEWRNPYDSYLTRIAKIQTGISSGGNTYDLIWGSGAGTTVHDDAAADTLRGDPAGSAIKGRDWFFANLAQDTILDRQAGEKVN